MLATVHVALESINDDEGGIRILDWEMAGDDFSLL